MVANKVDQKNERVIDKEQGEASAKKFGIPHLEASAVTGQGCYEMFEGFAAEILKKMIKRGE